MVSPVVFGNTDRDSSGKIRSEYPCYYNPAHKEDLEETVREMKNRLDRGLVPQESVQEHKDQIRMYEKKLSQINDSTPVLSDADKDLLSSVRKWLGVQISGSMFTYDEMNKGLADPHEEARRMVGPVIKIEKEEHASVLKSCGIENFHGCGMISRNQAEKAWKLIGRLLGLPTNTESLRKK